MRGELAPRACEGGHDDAPRVRPRAKRIASSRPRRHRAAVDTRDPRARARTSIADLDVTVRSAAAPAGPRATPRARDVTDTFTTSRSCPCPRARRPHGAMPSGRGHLMPRRGLHHRRRRTRL